MGKSMKPGGGGAFAAMKAKAAAEGANDPGAVAASIGRKKYGGKQMAEMASRGKERATAKRKGEAEPPLPKVKPLVKPLAKPVGDGLATGLKAAVKARS